MKVLDFKKAPKKPKAHSFLDLHPLNFISKKLETEGMLCRQVGKTGTNYEILPRIENVEMALKSLGIVARYNKFCRSIEVIGNLGAEDEGPLDDVKLTAIACLLEKTFGMTLTEANLKSKLTAISRKNKYDPLVDYYSGLSWDGTLRAETLWIHYANAEDSALNRAYGRLFLTCMVARCFFPGIKVDEIVTLIGDQGGGKSNLAKALTPIGEEAFTDQVVIGADSKKILEQTGGKALLEHSEDWRGRYSEQQRKACLSTTSDRARGAYQRLVSEVPRRFLFIATTNSDYPIQDPTGARREWLVQTKGQFKTLTPSVRDLLYAEIMDTVIAPILDSDLSEDMKRREVRQKLVLPKELWPEQAKIADSSLRAGYVTSAVTAGASEFSIRRQTGHASSVTMERYIRLASLFEDNPSGLLF